MRERKLIRDEHGEFINVCTKMIDSDGTPRHEVVNIEIGGSAADGNRYMILTLSPYDAIELANQILDAADSANETNYHLLVHKTPF